MSPEFNTASKFKKTNGFSAVIEYEREGNKVHIYDIVVYGPDLELEKYSKLIENFSKKLGEVEVLSIDATKSLERILNEPKAKANGWTHGDRNIYKKVF